MPVPPATSRRTIATEQSSTSGRTLRCSRWSIALPFAEVIAATLLGFLFFLAVSAIGRLLLRHWHESALEG